MERFEKSKRKGVDSINNSDDYANTDFRLFTFLSLCAINECFIERRMKWLHEKEEATFG